MSARSQSQPQPRSRRDRPAKPPLSREAIVAAALGVLNREGLERVTLRRVAGELDTGAASLYVYFENGAALHAALLDELLGSVPLAPVAAHGDWQTAVADVLWSYTGLLVQNASLARSAMITRPAGPHYFALVEYLLAALREGGVPGERAAWGIDLLLLFATGLSAEHAARGADANAEREQSEWQAAIVTADPDRYPNVAELGEQALTGDPEARYRWGVAALLAGIAQTPIGSTDPAARDQGAGASSAAMRSGSSQPTISSS